MPTCKCAKTFWVDAGLYRFAGRMVFNTLKILINIFRIRQYCGIIPVNKKSVQNVFINFGVGKDMMNKKLRYLMVLAFLGLFSAAQTAYADCAVTGTTGSGGEIVMCTGTDADGYTGTAFGDDITVPAGATVDHPTSDTIDLRDGDDVMLISGGTITSGEDAIEAGDGDDVIIMTSGSIIAASDGIRLQGGNDTLIITGGVVTGIANQGIEGGSGNDFISISNAVISGDGAIEAGSGDDVVEIGNNVTINGLLDGGSGNDVLRFSMSVPPADLAALQSALAAADPAAGSIVINDETYTWANFEAIEANLQSASAVGVPSLQFWGMLLLIGVLLLVAQQSMRKARRF